jgi:uncharacterized phage protein gp47/JayE
MSNGVTDLGFRRKRLDEILSDKNEAVKSVLGVNLNLSPESPDGQINGVLSESDANLWELAEACYTAFNPSGATGVALSNLVQLNNIQREEAIASTVILDGIVGVNGTVIPAGSLVSTADSSITVSTNSAVTIAGGVASVLATNIVSGEVIILATTMVKIDTPITGWTTANNNALGTTGQDRETDAELRSRRAKSISRAAVTPLDSIVAEVNAIPLVTYVAGFENETNSPNANGIPAHAVLILAENGSDNDIAQAILSKKTTGITSHGAASGTAIDGQGFSRTVNFQRPTNINIHVLVEINTFIDFPANGIAQIKQDIADYANGTFDVNKGFGVSENIIRTELFTPINSTIGLSVAALGIKAGSAAATSDTANIVINFDGRGVFAVANIVVTIL